MDARKDDPEIVSSSVEAEEVERLPVPVEMEGEAELRRV